MVEDSPTHIVHNKKYCSKRKDTIVKRPASGKSVDFEQNESEVSSKRKGSGAGIGAKNAAGTVPHSLHHLAEKVHHHHHNKPKDHEENFAWLDYQYDRKFSTMQRKTMKLSSSWEDLTANKTRWYEINWTFDNLMYKIESFKEIFSTKQLLSWLGLRVNELNIKMFGSHKAVYIQNLKMAKAMTDQNCWLIHPLSRARLCLDAVTIALLVLQIFVVPLEFSSENSYVSI